MKITQTITDYIRQSILTTKGDIVKRGISVPERLAVGSLRQVLMVNPIGDDVEYADIDAIKEATGEYLQCITIYIGSWDMVSVGNLVIPHGLSSIGMRSIDVVIFDDTFFRTSILNCDNDLSGSVSGSVVVDGDNLILTRAGGGYYDNPLFDEIQMNRGFVTIWYS